MNTPSTGERSIAADRLRLLWAKADSATVFRWSVFATAVYRLGVYWTLGRHSALTGDETLYWRNTLHVLNLARIEALADVSAADSLASIIGRGWFLPGMSIVAAPMRLLSDSPALARLWVGALAFALLVVASLQIRRVVSSRAATMFVLVVGWLPYSAWFSMTLWGGSIGGLLLLVNVLWAASLARSIRSGQSARWWPPLLLGASVGFSILIRPAALIQIFMIGALVTSAFLVGRSVLSAGSRAIAWLSVLLVSSVAVLAPWQVAMSSELGGRFFLVSSTPMNEILRFGDAAELGETGDSFLELGNYLGRLADARGQSLYEVTVSERDRIVAGVTLSDRLVPVGPSLRRFFGEPNFFLDRALGELPSSSPTGPLKLLPVVNWLGWIALWSTALVVLLRRHNWWDRNGLNGVLVWTTVPALLFQPLLRNVHGRHVNYLLPLVVTIVVTYLDSTNRQHEAGEPFRFGPVETAGSAMARGIAVVAVGFMLLG